MMKVYYATSGWQTGTVYVQELDGLKSEFPTQLRHHVKHSPDGFAWGYGGSGPAELARCILVDHLDLHDEPGRVHPALYQRFKEDFVAPLLEEGWSITSQQIDYWFGVIDPGLPRLVDTGSM